MLTIHDETSAVTATVIVPFHRNLRQLRACVAAIRGSMLDAELIVAADGAAEDCQAVATEHQAFVVVVPAGPAGPAVARNRAAERAKGHILLFVDADVVVAPDALPGMCAALAASPSLAGVFGAYDYLPPATNFVSQFKNLSHAYVHEIGNREAITFWAGLGAIRAAAFRAVGGFDERFRRPSVEDIDLGYRLVAAGFQLRLDPGFRGTHLKRWTLASCVRTDVSDRGIPWTQLLHRLDHVPNDLNISRSLRASVVVSYGFVIAALSTPFVSWSPATLAVLIALLVTLNYDYYRWLRVRRGWLFAARAVPLHLLHHLCNGISFIIGTVLHLTTRAGFRLPGALPVEPWPAALARLQERGESS